MSSTTKVKLNVISPSRSAPVEVPLDLAGVPSRPADVPAFDRREQSFKGRLLRALPRGGRTIERLRKRGYLTPMIGAEGEAFFINMSAQVQHTAVHRALSYILMPTLPV